MTAIAGSTVALILAVAVYGVAPLLLAHPVNANSGDTNSGDANTGASDSGDADTGVSNTGRAGTAEGSEHRTPLRDPHWWSGTAVQGVGFVASFFARHALPLPVVQPAIALSLAVTAALEARRRRAPMRRAAVIAGLALIVGLGVLAACARSGSAIPVGAELNLTAMLGLGIAAVGLTSVAAARPLIGAAAAGLAFSVVAVAARGLAARPLSVFTDLTHTGLAVIMIAAAGLGQALITRALRAGALTAPLAAMYLVEVVVPSGAGVALGTDTLRPATWPWAGLALAVSGIATVVLATNAAPVPEPSAVTASGPHAPAEPEPDGALRR